MEFGSVEKEIRKLRKSLRQIESLERLDRELTLDEAQKVLKKIAIRSALAERLSRLEENEHHHISVTESNTSLLTDGSFEDLLPDDQVARKEEAPSSLPLASAAASSLGTPKTGREDSAATDFEGAANVTGTEAPPPSGRLVEQKGPKETASSQNQPSDSANSSGSGKEGKSSSRLTGGVKYKQSSAIGLQKSQSPDKPASRTSQSPNKPASRTSQSPDKPASQTSQSHDKPASRTTSPSQHRSLKTKQSKWLNRQVVVTCLEGHCDVVSTLDSNGEILMTGSRDTTVRVWCLKKMVELRSMGGHTAAVTCVKLLPKDTHHLDVAEGEESSEGVDPGHQLGLSGSLDCHVILWDITAGKKLGHIYVFSSVMSLEYTEGKVITGSEGGKIEVWSLRSRQLLQTIRGPARSVTCLVLKGAHLFYGDVAGLVHVWKLDPPDVKDDSVWRASEVEFPVPVPFHTHCVRCLCVHGNVVYWGDDGTNIKLLDISNGSMHTLANHTHAFGSTGSLAVFEDEGILVAASYDLDTGQASINIRSLAAGEENMYLCSIQPSCPPVPYICTLVVIHHYANSSIRLCTGGNELRVWDFVFSKVSPERLTTGQSLFTPSCVLPDEASAMVDTDSDPDSDDDEDILGQEEDPLCTLHLKPLPQAKMAVPQVVRPESWFWWLYRCTVL